MKLSNSFIAVKKISSPVLRSQFSEDELTRTAELILKVEGIINPLILRITSAQSYEVVDGHFEYYAATRAKEIDSQKGEYIGAFIIDPDNEEVFQEQVELIRKREFGDNEIKKKLESLTAQIAKLAESVKKIENIFTNIEKPKRSNQKKTQKRTSEKSEYDTMTVTQLKEIAKQQKIVGSSKMNKGELITAITNILKS
ncbi:MULTISPECIES: Rho termination factor N-terminal domain-containing protein [unclassified Nostoc]|uniref:Rho termination factor N-terminal domain-containing protein n=1 Tax=unclassified Nostoc TaxID=2593658 RepID=UPI00261A944E|nr:Rho termination factor N-terminal domain-containing protein [Nostoc sp. S13]MDF5735351.1 Rho termination factor N-terminal domain-containing protein [Nostoc sp. S13]